MFKHALNSLCWFLIGLNNDWPPFATQVGLATQAVKAYVKVGAVKDAIAVCVELNQWDQAVKLASEHNVTEIDALLAKYASHLLSKDKLVEAIELYRQAKHYLDAAKHLFQLAQKMSTTLAPLRCKQLYILGALEIENYIESKRSGSDPTRSVLDGLLEEDALEESYARMLENPWRGAEAYHFLLLAQRQLYAGHYNEALRTAVRLADYDDLLDPMQVYSVLALAAIATNNYALCSKAFIKMEALGSPEDKMRQQVEVGLLLQAVLVLCFCFGFCFSFSFCFCFSFCFSFCFCFGLFSQVLTRFDMACTGPGCRCVLEAPAQERRRRNHHLHQLRGREPRLVGCTLLTTTLVCGGVGCCGCCECWITHRHLHVSP